MFVFQELVTLLMPDCQTFLTIFHWKYGKYYLIIINYVYEKSRRFCEFSVLSVSDCFWFIYKMQIPELKNFMVNKVEALYQLFPSEKKTSKFLFGICRKEIRARTLSNRKKAFILRISIWLKKTVLSNVVHWTTLFLCIRILFSTVSSAGFAEVFYLSTTNSFFKSIFSSFLYNTCSCTLLDSRSQFSEVLVKHSHTSQ